MGKTRRITVIASMRNEGAFIVEWVAWYRALGFTDVVVVTNHCTDHSPQLLDALGRDKRIHHMRVDPPPRSSINLRKLAAARGFRAVRWSEWVFVCDVDEFLVIHKGSGRIEELVGPPDNPPPFTAMSINWRVFGTCGIEEVQDIPVHQQFFFAKGKSAVISTSVKTLFRKPMAFSTFRDHAPGGWNSEIGGEWGKGDNLWVNADGTAIAGFSPLAPPLRQVPPEFASYEVAQINHYMLRSAETYSLKAGTKSGTSNRNRYTDNYRSIADSGKDLDQSALGIHAAFEAERAGLMAMPGIARLHALCCADHLRLIAEKHGRDPAADPRIAGFLAQAAEMASEMENGAPDNSVAP